MKRNIMWALFLMAALLMSLTAVAKEKEHRDDCTCSNATAAGTWGTTITGTTFNPATGAPGLLAAVSFATYDGVGSYWGTQTRSNNGDVSRVYFKGTYAVNSDCTGKKTTTSYADDKYTIEINTVEQDFVIVNDGEEYIEIFTALTLPNGTPVKTILTGHSRRQFSNSDNER